MRKVLLALLAVTFAAGGAMAAVVPGAGDNITLNSADSELIFTGGADHTLDGQVIMDSEKTQNFFFDMGNISADRGSRRDGTLTVAGGMRTNPALGTSVKHTVSVYGPGILKLGATGYWQGTTTIAYNYVSKDNTSDLASGDGYLQMGADFALPTWNPVTVNIPGSADLGYRSVLDINGTTQRIRDLENSYDVDVQGVIYLEDSRTDGKLPSVGKAKALVQGKGGVLELQSSRNGVAAGDRPNDLGFIHGYGEVRLYNTLTNNAPTVYEIISKEPGTGPRLVNAEDTKGRKSDEMDNGLGLVGFVFGDGTTIGSQVTLKVHDDDPATSTDVRVRFISGGAATGSTLDLSRMQFGGGVANADRFIVDTDGDFTYLGKFVYSGDYAAPGVGTAGIWEPNFVKTGWGVQTVTDRALAAGAVFKVDAVTSGDNYYGSILDGRTLVSSDYPDGELRFLMEKDVNFSAMNNLADRPVFLAGAGTYGFDTELDRTADVGMLMNANAAPWPGSAAPIPVGYNSLLPFDNTNVHVYAGTLKNAVFGYADISTGALVTGNQFTAATTAPYDVNFLNPEMQLIAPTHHGATTGFAFLKIHKEAGNLTVDDGATVVLTPWSWSALGSLKGSGTVVMDSPRTMTGTTVTTTTFLRVERSSTLEADFADQYHRAYLWLGVNDGKTSEWFTRYFVLGDSFNSNVDRIIVTRGAALNIAGFGKPELNSSVAFYGTRTSTEEPATYRVNVGEGGKSSTLSIKDGNSFYFADPADLAGATEGSVKLEFAGTAKAGDVFTILRGQNASEGQYRFVYDTVNWRLYSLTEELGRNLYAEALNDMLAPKVIGLGQEGRFNWTLDEVNKNRLVLGIVTDPATGIQDYSYVGDELPVGVEFNGLVNGVRSKVSGLAAGHFRFTNELTQAFTGEVAAKGIYGWSVAEQVKFTVTPVTPVDPTIPVKEGIVEADPGNPAELKAGEPVELSFTFNTASFDVSTLKLVTKPSTDWEIQLPATEDGATEGLITFKVVGTMPAEAVTYYFTAVSRDDGETYRTGDRTLALTGAPKPSDGSSGGCDAGFAGLTLLLAAPFFLRKRS